MSIENVKKFFELAKSDEKLVREITKIRDEIQSKGETADYEDIIKTKIISMAQKNGLKFTLEDFLKYTSTIAQGELSEEDLLNVSGGFSAKQGLAMLGIMMTLTPLASGFMTNTATADPSPGEQGPTSSYSVSVDNNADNNDEQNSEFEETEETNEEIINFNNIDETNEDIESMANNEITAEADEEKVENQNVDENKEFTFVERKQNNVPTDEKGNEFKATDTEDEGTFADLFDDWEKWGENVYKFDTKKAHEETTTTKDEVIDSKENVTNTKVSTKKNYDSITASAFGYDYDAERVIPRTFEEKVDHVYSFINTVNSLDEVSNSGDLIGDIDNILDEVKSMPKNNLIKISDETREKLHQLNRFFVKADEQRKTTQNEEKDENLEWLTHSMEGLNLNNQQRQILINSAKTDEDDLAAVVKNVFPGKRGSSALKEVENMRLSSKSLKLNYLLSQMKEEEDNSVGDETEKENNNTDETVDSNEGNEDFASTDADSFNVGFEEENLENNEEENNITPASLSTTDGSERGVLDELMSDLMNGTTETGSRVSGSETQQSSTEESNKEITTVTVNTENKDNNAEIRKDGSATETNSTMSEVKSTSDGSSPSISGDTNVSTTDNILTRTENGSAAKTASDVKLTINTLKKAVELVFDNNIDESKGTSSSNYQGGEIIYGYDANSKPFALSSSGYVYSYNNGASNATLQQKLSSDNILEINKAELAAEEAAKAKSEAATSVKSVVDTKPEAEANKDETVENSVASSATKVAKKTFYSKDDFASYTENVDDTITAVDQDGETYTFVKYDKSKYENKTQEEQLTYLAATLEKIENDPNNMLGEDRISFWPDLGNFVRHAWNAKNNCLEVTGISKDDSRFKTILDFCKKIEFKPSVNSDIAENLTLQEKLKALANIVNRVNSLEDIGDQYGFVSVLQETLNSKEYNTADGTINGLITAGSEDEQNYQILLAFWNANKEGHRVEYYKQGSLMKANKLSEDADKLINNWIETGNKIHDLSELKNSADFKNDATDIAKSIEYRYQDGEVSFEISGAVSSETVKTFLNIWYGLGLSKNVSYTSVSSDDRETFASNLLQALDQIESNTLNIARNDLGNYVKDYDKAMELSNQSDAKKKNSTKGHNTTSRRSTINQILSKKSVEELNQEINDVNQRINNTKDETEKADLIVASVRLARARNKLLNNENKEAEEKQENSNNNENAVTGRTQMSANNVEEKTDSKKAQASTNDEVKAAEEKVQASTNDKVNIVAKEFQENTNNNEIKSEAEKLQENQNKNVKYIPFKSNMGGMVRSWASNFLGGKSSIEQKKDHLAKFIDDEGIITLGDISEDSTGDFYTDVMDVGSKLTYNTINNTWYLEGSIPEPSQNRALELVHRIYRGLLNNS